VINLRSDLSSRWRHASYDFFVGNKKLLNWSQVKISSRLVKSNKIFKLGVYFSHFIFSSSLDNYFLDRYFDQKFLRFRAKVPKITKNLTVMASGLENVQVSAQIIDNTNNGFKFFRLVTKYKKFKYLEISNLKSISFFIISKFLVRTNKVLNSSKLVFAPTVFQKLIQVEQVINFRQFATYVSQFPASQIKLSKSKNRHSIFFDTVIVNDHSYVSELDFIKLNKWFEKFYGKNYFRRFAGYVSDDIQGLVIGSIMDIFSFFSSYYFRVNPFQFMKMFSKTKEFMLSFWKTLNDDAHYHSDLKFRWLNFSYKNICNWLLKEFYMSFRVPIFEFINKKFQANQSAKLGVFTSNYYGPCKLNFENLSNYNALPAVLISSIFTKRLQNRERVNPVLYSLMRLVLNKKKVLGLVIYRGGRFTKKQRTLRSTLRFGRVSFNSYVMPIDYGFSTAILKYSIVAVKIWISTPPPAVFFSRGLELSSNLTYPSVLQSFRIYKYFYFRKIFKFVEVMDSIQIYNSSNINLISVSSVFFMSSINFISSWNFKHFRAYRQFSKFYLFSKAKYFSKLQKLL
jgi:hypothetical protein